MKRFAILTLTAVLLAGCTRHPNDPNPSAEQRTIAVTRWSDKTELFMEHPLLIAGQTARFAIHFTSLRDFKPLTEGRVTVELVQGNSVVHAFATDSPSRPGIFGVDVHPSSAGIYTLRVRLASRAATDAHDIPDVRVSADAKQAAASAGEPEGEEAIPFLKEQQWKMDFATDPVTNASLRASIRVPAEVQPPTGGQAEIVAPVAGRLSAPGNMPAVGMKVSKGQVLVRLIPRTSMPADRAALESAYAQAKGQYELAQRDRERAERLFAARAVPAKRAEEARAAEASAEAQWKAANDRLRQDAVSRTSAGELSGEGVFQLRSPIAGVVAETVATPGAAVEEGTRLFRIIATDTVHVVASVPESELPQLRSVTGADLEFNGAPPVPLSQPLSVGRVVDPSSRTVSVIYSLSNRDHKLAVGQAVFLRIFTGTAVDAAAIPESAVVDDGGRSIVFVQIAGESFARRPVALSSREGGRIQVLDGVKPGERVVSRGAYLIRLAALSTQIPAHGHVH